MSSNFDIILVDDDPDFLFLHEILVKKAGLDSNPKKFSDGQKLVEFLKATPLEKVSLLLLLDIYMPGLDGWAILDYIESLKLPGNIKVILLSSSVNFDDKRKAMEYASVIEYIEKPLMLEYLERLKVQAIF
ncbi:MAG: response regulator [Bacteroidota bacterium]